MQTNEIEQLIRSVTQGLSKKSGSSSPDQGESITPSLSPATKGAVVETQSLLRLFARTSEQLAPAGVRDVAQLAAEVSLLRRGIEQPTGESSRAVQSASSKESSSSGSATSVISTVLRTAGLVTGLGPIATGLKFLFGRSKEEERPTPAFMYESPRPLAVESGLNADRQFSDFSYGLGGTIRAIPRTQSASVSPAQNIQVNVQAMDSRSFLDHSEEIARAVREAMLHSHSLNDVVAEL